MIYTRKNVQLKGKLIFWNDCIFVTVFLCCKYFFFHLIFLLFTTLSWNGFFLLYRVDQKIHLKMQLILKQCHTTMITMKNMLKVQVWQALNYITKTIYSDQNCISSGVFSLVRYWFFINVEFETPNKLLSDIDKK